MRLFLPFSSSDERSVHSIYSPGRPRGWQSSDLPEKAGKYYIVDGGELRYIGITGNLKARIRQHVNAGRISSASEVRFKVIDESNIRKMGLTIKEVEQFMRDNEKCEITERGPAENKIAGGGGRSPNLAYIESVTKEMEERFIDKIKSKIKKLRFTR